MKTYYAATLLLFINYYSFFPLLVGQMSTPAEKNVVAVIIWHNHDDLLLCFQIVIYHSHGGICLDVFMVKR